MGYLSLYSTVVAYTTAILVTYLVSLFSYCLLLHPLRRYPGPFWAKLTDAYAGFYAGSRSIHVRTRQDHLKYGPVIRHGPNKLIFSSVQAVKDIYLSPRLDKSFAYQYTAATPGVYGVFNVIDKSVHRFKRKLVGQALSERSLRIFEPTMLEQIRTFLDVLRSASSSTSSRGLPLPAESP
ncbi:hypothetical protein PG990_009012 [Apiospora arundinis]